MAKNESQNIEQLRERFDELRDRRTTAQANLKTTEARLKKLQEDAKTRYGTDDPKALQQLLEKIRAENEAKRATYQQHLDKIDADLSALEAAEPES